MRHRDARARSVRCSVDQWHEHVLMQRVPPLVGVVLAIGQLCLGAEEVQVWRLIQEVRHAVELARSGRSSV